VVIHPKSCYYTDSASWLFFTVTKNDDPAHTRKADEGVDIQLYPFLTLALDGVGSQLHAPAGRTHRETALPYPIECWIGGGGERGAGPIWKMWRRGKFLTPARISITISQMSSTVQSLYRPH